MIAGTVNGYCVVWGAISHDFGARGASPRYERIEKGALKIASNAISNINHFEMSSFAFAADSTLQFGCDNFGLWFRAVLPESWNGYGIKNSLTGGRCIGASVEIDKSVTRYDEAAGVEIVTSGVVVGVALVQRDLVAWRLCEACLDVEAASIMLFE
jgi:hypothetical protein